MGMTLKKYVLFKVQIIYNPNDSKNELTKKFQISFSTIKHFFKIVFGTSYL